MAVSHTQVRRSWPSALGMVTQWATRRCREVGVAVLTGATGGASCVAGATKESTVILTTPFVYLLFTLKRVPGNPDLSLNEALPLDRKAP
jgi:hypothetical protein